MIIRTASKNFLCEKCNNVINKGEKYFDWWNINQNGVYYHRRFHQNCLNNKKVTDNLSQSKLTNNKSTIFDRIQKSIDDEGGCLIALNYLNNEKCYICGIHYDEKGNKSFLCETWEDRKPFYESADNMKKYIDCYGNYL